MPSGNSFRGQGRGRGTSSIRKLADNSLTLGQVVEPAIDQQRMKATAIICTPAVDREGEVIVPRGVTTDNFARNPVILWEHGFDSSISIPIAKGIGPDGKLGIRLVGDSLEGDAYFTKKVKQSEQIFDLIVEKIVRATSIHVIPQAREQAYEGGQQVTIYPRSSLLEWSFGRLGVNPEAVMKVLNHGKLAGSPICESIAKTLRSIAPKPSRSTVRVGWDAVFQDHTMSKNLPTPNQGETEESFIERCLPILKSSGKLESGAAGKAKAVGVIKSFYAGCTCNPKKALPPKKKDDDEEEEGGEYGGEGSGSGEGSSSASASGNGGEGAGTSGGTGGSNGGPPEGDVEEAPAGAPSEETPSVRVGKAVQSSLENLMRNLEGASSTYEEPRAKEYFTGPFTSKCNEMITEVKGLISQLGGTTQVDPQEQPGEENAQVADEEAVKTFLNSGNKPFENGLRLSGYVAPLVSLSRAKNLTHEQRLTLNTVLKSVRNVVDQAKKEADEAKKASLAKSLKAASDKQTEFELQMKQLNKALLELNAVA